MSRRYKETFHTIYFKGSYNEMCSSIVLMVLLGRTVPTKFCKLPSIQGTRA